MAKRRLHGSEPAVGSSASGPNKANGRWRMGDGEWELAKSIKGLGQSHAGPMQWTADGRSAGALWRWILGALLWSLVVRRRSCLGLGRRMQCSKPLGRCESGDHVRGTDKGQAQDDLHKTRRQVGYRRTGPRTDFLSCPDGEIAAGVADGGGASGGSQGTRGTKRGSTLPLSRCRGAAGEWRTASAPFIRRAAPGRSSAGSVCPRSRRAGRQCVITGRMGGVGSSGQSRWSAAGHKQAPP
jgi:hypothetical protein